MKRLFFSLPGLLCFLVLGCSSAPKPPAIRIVELKDLETILNEYQGNGLLVDFWAIWCEPCVEELPYLIEISHQYREQGGVVLGISYDLMAPGVNREEVLSQMHDYVAEHRLDIPILIFDGPDYDAINERFELPGPVPYTLAIDQSGAIVDRQDGKAGKDRFAEMMRKALGN
jgi:thiol-disulfide isomerase/thioredoxin